MGIGIRLDPKENFNKLQYKWNLSFNRALLANVNDEIIN